MSKKNKAVKVLIIVLVILAVIYLIINFALYSFAKSIMDEVPINYGEYEHYNAGIIDDYQVITCEGISIKAPTILEPMLSEDDTEEDENSIKRRAFISPKNSDGKSEYVVAFTTTERREVIGEFEKTRNAFPKSFDRFLHKMGKEKLDNWYDMVDFVYSIDGYKFNPISITDNIFFTGSVAARRIVYFPEYKGVYHFETDEVKGFIYIKVNDSGTSYVVEVFEKSDPAVTRDIVIKCPDEETVYKIINSIELEK